MSDNLLELALKYAKLRWKIHPCHGFDANMSCTCGRGHKDPRDAGKHPVLDRWNELSSSDEYDIKNWWSEEVNYNIALHCGKSNLFVIDIDPRSGGDQSYEKLIQMLDEKGINLPQTVEAITGKYVNQGEEVRGRHIYFKCGPGAAFIGNLSSLGLPGIDIKHNGYVLLPGSRHISGVNYQWFEGRDPWTIEISEAPEGFLSLIRKAPRSRRAAKGINWDEFTEHAEKLDIKLILEKGVQPGERNDTCHKMAVIVTNVLTRNGRDEITDLTYNMIHAYMREFNRTMVSPPLPGDELETLTNQAINFVGENPLTTYADKAIIEWASRVEMRVLDPEDEKILGGDLSEGESKASRITRSDVGKAILIDGKSLSEASSRKVVDLPEDVDSIYAEDGGVPGSRSCTDIGNARRLVDLWGAGVAYTPDIGFKVWEGGRWKTDKEGLHMQELTKKLPSIIDSESADKDKEAYADKIKAWAKMSRSNAKIKAAIEGAKSDPRIHIDLETWDSNPELFGVKNGVVNLRTGEPLKSAPEHYISIISNIQYIPGLTNEKWLNFLWEATGGDQELIDYLQLLMGYTMTAYSYLDIISLIYGPPGTGKNTFIESCFSAMGDYAWPLDLSVISNANGMNSGSDLYHIAELLNRRAIWVDELPEGEKLKETTLKKLSGSSLMSARSPGGRPFSFKLVAKTVISTNHRPPIQDDAMWRRLIAIPFVHKPKKIDPTLKRYLSDPEGGQMAVLAWMVEGAVKFLAGPQDSEHPFGFSKAVQESTEMYRRSEDKTGLFIEENLREKPGASVLMSTVFTEYQNWTLRLGEKYLTQASFQKKLIDKGIRVVGNASSAEIIGYELKSISNFSSPVGKTKIFDLPEINVSFDDF